MAYNLEQKAKLKHVQYVGQRAKAAIEAAIAALPVEMFLDQAKTRFVQSFAFTQETYPGGTDPNLNGKPVLVLALKARDHNNNNAETVTYSFLNMETLVDTYTAKAGDSAKILNIAGYEIEVKIDPSNDNAIEVTANGLKVNISGKADKVANATAGHVASLDANGNLADSGVIAANILTTADVTTDVEATEMIDEIFGAAS